MSIEGSLALAGLALVALGVAVSARRASRVSAEGTTTTGAGCGTVAADHEPAATSSSNVVGSALLVVGVGAVLVAGAGVAAMWVLFSRLF